MSSLVPDLLQELDSVLETRISELSKDSPDGKSRIQEIETLRSILGAASQAFTRFLVEEKRRPTKNRRIDSDPSELTLNFDFEVRCLSHSEVPATQLIPTGLRNEPRSAGEG